jgi:hypothetical protein
MGILDKIIQKSEYRRIHADIRTSCITVCHDIINEFGLHETEIHFDDNFVYHKPIGNDEYSQHHIQSIKMDKFSYISVNVDGEWKQLHECGMIEHTMIEGKMKQYANNFKNI